jgi:hypothetical protein
MGRTNRPFAFKAASFMALLTSALAFAQFFPKDNNGRIS